MTAVLPTPLYVLSGLLAGLTGMVFYIRLGAGAPTSGDGFELIAIAAVVIGGVSLTGGVGSLTGTVLGALILTVVSSGLIISNVSPNWNPVARQPRIGRPLDPGHPRLHRQM